MLSMMDFIEQVDTLFRAFAHKKAAFSNEQGLSMSGGPLDGPGHNYPPGSGGFLVGEEVPPVLTGAEGSAAPGVARSGRGARPGGRKG